MRPGAPAQGEGSDSDSAPADKTKDVMFATVLTQLEQCAIHGEKIEFYLEEDVEEGQNKLGSVTYACKRCMLQPEMAGQQGAFTQIDDDNLLNVYQLKQELLKER